MATRSTIKVEGVNYAKIYKHYDSYPSEMMPWLEEFNKNFVKKRGIDSEYKFAQVLRDSIKIDNSEYTGWGVIPFNSNAGEDYEYILKNDGTVICNET